MVRILVFLFAIGLLALGLGLLLEQPGALVADLVRLSHRNFAGGRD